MNATPSWIDMASVIAAIFSTLTAIIALWVAVRSDRRSRDALKVQTYLQLRNQFIDIYRNSGSLDESDSPAVEVRQAREAYWHHTWDEFFITRRLAPREFSMLWDQFFKSAIESGLDHPAMVKAFDDLASKRAGFGAYAQDLIAEIRAMQKRRAAGSGP